MSLFEKYLIAHLIGDYLLQNNWMALRKGKKLYALSLHCAIYALCFGIIFQDFFVFLAVYWLHLILDKSYKGATITEWWLRLIGGRSLKSVFQPLSKDMCQNSPAVLALYSGFTAVIYCICDFLLHFTFQYPAILWILKTIKERG